MREPARSQCCPSAIPRRQDGRARQRTAPLRGEEDTDARCQAQPPLGSRADRTIPLNTCPLRADTRLGPGGTLRGCRPPNRLPGSRSTSIRVVASERGGLFRPACTAGVRVPLPGEDSRPEGDEHDHEDDREHDHQRPDQVQGDTRPPLTPTSTAWSPPCHLLDGYPVDRQGETRAPTRLTARGRRRRSGTGVASSRGAPAGRRQARLSDGANSGLNCTVSG